jgi:hypothetical protein
MSEAAAAPPEVGLNDLIKIVLGSELSREDQVAIINELRKTAPAFSDRWLYRYVVWLLGSAAILTAGGLIALGAAGSDIPQGLVALGSGAIGGLAGLFTTTPRGRA